MKYFFQNVGTIPVRGASIRLNRLDRPRGISERQISKCTVPHWG